MTLHDLLHNLFPDPPINLFHAPNDKWILHEDLLQFFKAAVLYQTFHLRDGNFI